MRQGIRTCYSEQRESSFIQFLQNLSHHLSVYKRALEGKRVGVVATNRKFTCSMPDGVIGPGVDSGFNRNGHQEYSLRAKAAGAQG